MRNVLTLLQTQPRGWNTGIKLMGDATGPRPFLHSTEHSIPKGPLRGDSHPGAGQAGMPKLSIFAIILHFFFIISV